MIFKLSNLHPVKGRRSISTMLLVLVAISGLAFSAPRSVMKDRSIPFPCMDSKCSCRDAAMCWDECGCLSTEQKIAWAERHGVTPPAWFDVSRCAADSGATVGGCCTRQESCRSKDVVAKRLGCQGEETGRPTRCANDECGQPESKNDSRCDPSDSAKPDGANDGANIGRRRCHGIERLYVLLSLIAPVSPTPRPAYPLTVDRLGPIASVSFLGLVRALFERPPRSRD